MRQPLTRSFVLIAVAAAGGCDRHAGDRTADTTKELLLFAGAGIRPPVTELAERFGRANRIDIVLDYAGSELLLSKIRLARRGDVYMPGDKRDVDRAAEAGLILSQSPVCYFLPTLLVQKGNPRSIGGLRDLSAPGIRLGLGDAKACAIGRISRELFEKNNIPWEDIERNLRFQSMTVNELGLQIQARSLDAVIVWDAVARSYSKHGDDVPIPGPQTITSTVNAGILKYTAHRGLAERFIAFARSERGRQIFVKHGYRVEPPE
jgi:molybdate transport system substrate-binding protein